MTKKKRKHGGRKAGTRNIRRDLFCDVAVSRCPNCQSTDRPRYRDKPEPLVVPEQQRPDGTPYNVVILRKSFCLNCKKHRIDKSYLYTRNPERYLNR